MGFKVSCGCNRDRPRFRESARGRKSQTMNSHTHTYRIESHLIYGGITSSEVGEKRKRRNAVHNRRAKNEGMKGRERQPAVIRTRQRWRSLRTRRCWQRGGGRERWRCREKDPGETMNRRGRRRNAVHLLNIFESGFIADSAAEAKDRI